MERRRGNVNIENKRWPFKAAESPFLELGVEGGGGWGRSFLDRTLPRELTGHKSGV